MQACTSGSTQRIFFHTLQNDRAHKVDKNILVEISPKILFWAKWAILAQLWLKIIQAFISGLALRIFFQI